MNIFLYLIGIGIIFYYRYNYLIRHITDKLDHFILWMNLDSSLDIKPNEND